MSDQEGFAAGIERELTILSGRLPLKGPAAAKLGHLEYLVLKRLNDQDEAMSVRELASALKIDASAMKQQVAALRQKRLVDTVKTSMLADGRWQPTTVGTAQLNHDQTLYRERPPKDDQRLEPQRPARLPETPGKVQQGGRAGSRRQVAPAVAPRNA